MKAHPLIRALSILFPDADFALTSLRDWHSMTLAGQRMTIECVTGLPDDMARSLPSHDFALPKALVADIMVVASEKIGDTSRLVIEALLIDEN